MGTIIKHLNMSTILPSSFLMRCFLGALFMVMFMPTPAYALEFNSIVRNILASVSDVPAIIAAFAYLIGLALAVQGITAMRDLVENRNNVQSMRIPIAKIMGGAAMFALPTIYDAVYVSIAGGGDNILDLAGGTFINEISGDLGGLSEKNPQNDFNNVLLNIISSISQTPALIAAAAYILATIVTFGAIVETKKHVEDPTRSELKQGIMRFILGGFLFALPTFYNAVFATVSGSRGLQDNGGRELNNGLSLVNSNYFGDSCDLSGPFQSIARGVTGTVDNVLGAVGVDSSLTPDQTLGGALCSIVTHTGAFPAFLTAIGYILALGLGFWGLLKLRDHVLKPDQVGVSEGLSRLLASGMFFSLPGMVSVMRATVSPDTGFLGNFANGTSTIQNAVRSVESTLDGVGSFLNGLFGGGDDSASQGGLDVALTSFMNDIATPLHVLTNVFAFIVGMIFIMIGISRLIKNAQEGAKAPVGIGTVMTF